MEELKYINTDYRIVLQYNRHYGLIRSVNRLRTLVGRSGLISEVGEELAIKMTKMAYRGNSAKITCKLRRGLQVIFYLR